MAKRKYIVTEAYLALEDRNLYRGNEIELESSNPGTAKLLDIGAIEELKVKKEKVEDGSND